MLDLRENICLGMKREVPIIAILQDCFLSAIEDAITAGVKFKIILFINYI